MLALCTNVKSVFSLLATGGRATFARLATNEDKLHLHKVTGLFVLLSFLIRTIWLFLARSPTMTAPNFINVLTLGAHCVLLSSAMQFEVAKRRFIVNRSLEYDEMRLHTILFSLRSIVAILLCWMNWFELFAVPLINILVWHTIADIVTKLYGSPVNGTTVRGGDTQQWTKYFASTSQLVATSVFLGSLSGHIEDALYFSMLPIQVNTFLMTLGRKGLISSRTKAICYGSSLFVLYPLFLHGAPLLFFILVIGMIVWRLCLGLSKHLMWLLVYVAARYA